VRASALSTFVSRILRPYEMASLRGHTSGRCGFVTPCSPQCLHGLVGCSQTFPSLLRIHVKQCSTGRGPGVALPLEYGAGVADVGDSSDIIHVTACDGFKSQVDRNQQIRLIRRAITEQNLNWQPVAVSPPQAAWKSCGRCQFEILTLKRLTMAFELPQ
jgi:hypothetical protein